MKRKLLASASAVAVISSALLVPVFAAPVSTFVAAASQTGAHATLVSDYNAPLVFGAIKYAYSGSTLSGLTHLSADFNVTDDDCNKSPYFQITVMTGSGVKKIFAYMGPSPTFTGCAPNTWTPSGDLLESGKTIDTTQLPGGMTLHDYDTALALYGTLPVVELHIVVDAGYAFGDQEQTVKIDNVRINNDYYFFSPPCSPVNNANLAGYWKFDEGAGLVALDSSPNDNSGALLNGPAYVAGNPMITPNPFALDFDGFNDTVSVPDAASLDFGNSDSFSASAWMVGGPSGNFQTVIHKLDDMVAAKNGYLLTMLNGTPEVWLLGDYSTNNYIRVASNTVVPDGSWHHVAFTYNGSGLASGVKIYVDGVDTTGPTHSDTLSGSMLNNQELEMGFRTDAAGQPFNGVLDDVRLYGRVLSAAEVENLSYGCTQEAASSSSSSSSVPPSSSSSSSSVSSSSSSVSSSSSSSSSAPVVPVCDGQNATIYVHAGKIVGGPSNGQNFLGTLNGTSGADVIVGTTNADVINGMGGADRICGRGSNDNIDGGSGADRLFGEAGNDNIDGGLGADFIAGEGGNDTLDGGIDIDILCGGLSNDLIEAGTGNDKLDGGPGSDLLKGETGTDICANGELNNTCENIVTPVPECAAY